MSSSNLATSTIPPAQRKIAPLPLRARSRSAGIHPLGATSSAASDSLSSEPSLSHRRTSYQNSDAALTVNQGLSTVQSVPRIAFQFSQPESNSLPSEEEQTYTFHQLPNATPTPSSEAEPSPLSSSQPSPARKTYSPLPKRVTPDQEISQPLHTMYSDEKIAIPSAPNSPEIGSRVTIEEHFDIAVGSPRVSSGGLEVSNLDSGLGASRQRSVSEVSDVSINDDSNTDTGPYDVKSEEAPLETFYTAAFQTALQDGLIIANKVVTAIEECAGLSEPASELERLFNDAKKLGTFQSSETRTIAVLGDSGEGKSSLINALLHFPEIAKTGDIGAACTSVVTEYRQRSKDHTSPITIEVQYLSKPEIEDLIKELLWNYRQIFLPGVEEDQVNPKDYARYQRESEQAWSALEAGFKHQSSFNKQILGDMTERGLAKATNQLVKWAHELEWPAGGSSGIWRAAVDTAEECCEATSIFMQDKFWPFTKIIRVYLSAEVLKTGIVLADLPGLQDTNLARVRATQTYLMKCDNVFIIAKISRVITDQSVKSSLYNVLARHAPVEWEESGVRGLNLAIVCTKSEDINQKTARREFCGPQQTIHPSVMERLDKEIENAKQMNDKKQKKILKRKQEFLLVDARNRFVKEGLRKAYTSKIPGGHLEVFCVSNTTYEKFSRKGNTEMVHASGIPELRQFCYTITAAAQLLEAKHFLRSTLSSLLSSVELWASSCPPATQVEDGGRDESILDFLEEIKAEVELKIVQSRVGYKETFREVLSEYLERRNHYWEVAAAAKGQEWTSWHWTQYNAWCMNRGNHSTPKRDHLNWNSEIIWKMRMELAYQWGLLEDEIPTVFDGLLQSIKICFLKLQAHLRDQGFLATLVEGIDFRIQDVEYKFGLIRQEFSREVKLVQRHASEPNDSSYVVAEMIPAYRAASQVSGPGKAARQRSIVQGRITDGTLFPYISAKIQGDIEDLIKSSFKDLKKVVNRVLSLIVDDVKMALASRPEPVDNAGVQEKIAEEQRKSELMAKMKELKLSHEHLLLNLSNL